MIGEKMIGRNGCKVSQQPQNDNDEDKGGPRGYMTK
jgi:hypothetical protein